MPIRIDKQLAVEALPHIGIFKRNALAGEIVGGRNFYRLHLIVERGTDLFNAEVSALLNGVHAN